MNFPTAIMKFGRQVLLISNSNFLVQVPVRVLLLLRCLVLTPKTLGNILVTNIRYVGKKRIIVYLGMPSEFYNIEKIINYLQVDKPDWHMIFCSPNPAHDFPVARTGRKVTLLTMDFFSLCCLKGEILLTPTDIPYKAVKPVGSLGIYFVHSLVGIKHISHTHAFDGADYIFAAGSRQCEDFAVNFRSRKKEGIIIIPGGYPKIDHLMERQQQPEHYREHNKTTVIALTYDNGKNSDFTILHDVSSLVEVLLRYGYRVVLRPHPLSFTIEKDFCEIQTIKRFYNEEKKVIIDRSKDYYSVLRDSSFMVSDISGTAFTYAMSFLKPVIFYSPNTAQVDGFHFQDRNKIGKVVHTVTEFDEAVNDIEKNYLSVVEQVHRYRKSSISNIGWSSEYFMSIFDTLSEHGIPVGATKV